MKRTTKKTSVKSPIKSNNCQKYAPIITRIGMVLVFLWFGITQILNPENWVGRLPDFLTSIFDATTLIYINGTAEIILALMLLAGLWTRIVAALLAIHLLAITISLGWSPSGARDFGLTLATLSIAFHGNDEWCFARNWLK